MKATTALFVVCGLSGAIAAFKDHKGHGSGGFHLLADSDYDKKPRSVATWVEVSSASICLTSTVSATVAPTCASLTPLCTADTTIAGTATDLTYNCPTSNAISTETRHTVYVTVTETITTTPILTVTIPQSSGTASQQAFTSVETAVLTTVVLSTKSVATPKVESTSIIKSKSTHETTKSINMNTTASGILWTGVASGCSGTVFSPSSGSGYRTGLIGNWTSPATTYRVVGSQTPTLLASGAETKVLGHHHNDARSNSVSVVALVLSLGTTIVLI